MLRLILHAKSQMNTTKPNEYMSAVHEPKSSSDSAGMQRPFSKRCDMHVDQGKGRYEQQYKNVNEGHGLEGNAD